MKPEAARLHAYVLIGLVSCSLLMWEVLLTRICALRLAFHFGYLVISTALLAIGASGTFLALFQHRLRPRARESAWIGSLLYVVAVLVTYAFLLTFPVDTPESGQLDLSDTATLVRFAVFNIVAAVPFFFGGAVVGMLLTFHAEQVNRLYFVDLVGAALGCLLSPLSLILFGAGGCMLVLGLLGLAGTVAATPPARRRLALPAALVYLVAFAGLTWTRTRPVAVPGKVEVSHW